ncbi:MAG TPA: DUF1028 domain-containing protein [Acidisoma sp.]|uniref:DUF1028 domain-containing protein n=1 Tax=Acidisoma sp. TaxID=1872115 RepID=UPI002B9E8E7D|nr:DUF1028 domain-containing protein [Acidisoma sp.]HTI02083.1 DUF1028 domain-containing protein [Acidisoma sp.]
MTFSIAARCAKTGRFGVAVASSSPAVAARCAHGRAGIGAVTSQNVTDPRLGRQALDLLALGASGPEARNIIAATAPHAAHRQLTVIDARGRTAAFSGIQTLGLHAEAEGLHVVSAGNLLANTSVPRAIVRAFEATDGQALGDRILAGMAAGLAAGGEAGPIRSAGMLLFGDVPWAIADLRIDWHDAPIAELGLLWEVWKPQMEAYVTRALNPSDAPSYGVPGDE